MCGFSSTRTGCVTLLFEQIISTFRCRCFSVFFGSSALPLQCRRSKCTLPGCKNKVQHRAEKSFYGKRGFKLLTSSTPNIKTRGGLYIFSLFVLFFCLRQYIEILISSILHVDIVTVRLRVHNAVALASYSVSTTADACILLSVSTLSQK